MTTTFQNGQFQGMTETLTFGAVCGEETLTMTNGATVPVTLHCL